MKASLLAIIVDDNNKISKYRLGRIKDSMLDYLEVIDVTEYQLYYALKTNQITVRGLKAGRKNNVEVSGIDLDRYTHLDCNGQVVGDKARLVIIKSIEDKKYNKVYGFFISNYLGQLRQEDMISAINLAFNIGIANGKLINYNYTRGHGEILPIVGKFDTVDVHNITLYDNNISSLEKYSSIFKPGRISLDEFDTKMNEAGYKYTIKYDYTGKILMSVDDRLKFIPIPDEITYINSGNRSGVDQNSIFNLEAIYISPCSSLDMDRLFLGKDSFPNLKQIIFDDGISTFKFGPDKLRYSVSLEPYLNGMDIKYNVPKHVEIIDHCWVFGSEDNVEVDINLSEFKSLIKIRDSFQGGTLLNSHSSNGDNCIELGTVREIHNSFRDINNKINIKFTKYQESILGFEHLTVDYIDFSEAKNLETIGRGFGSFNNIKNLKKVDLSACEKLQTLPPYSFRDLPDLEEIILPPNLVRICNNAISDCPKLKHIEIPKSVRYILNYVFSGTGINTLTIHNASGSFEIEDENLEVIVDGTTKISRTMFRSSKLKSITLSDDITSIDYGAFSSATVKEINFPLQLKVIGESAFQYFRIGATNNLGSLDLHLCTNLIEIGDSAFESADLKWVILPDSVTTLGNKVFKNVTEIKWLYIPKSVTKVGQRVLQNCGSNYPMGVTVYTQIGSVIDKYCKRNNIITVYVDSYEDALRAEKIIDVPESEKRKLTKLKMLESDGKNSQLFDSSYAGREIELYEIYTRCKKIVQDLSIDLIENNLVSIPIIDLLTQEEISTITNIEKSKPNSKDFELCAYINYITTFSTNHNKLLRPDYFKFLREGKIKSINIFEKSHQYKIITFELELKPLYAELWLVCKGNNVVYCTIFNEDSKLCKPTISNMKEVVAPIETVLKSGTPYPLTLSSIYCRLPNYIFEELSSRLDEQLILIGYKGLKPSDNDGYSGVSKIYLYSLVSQNIIEASASLLSIHNSISKKDIQAFAINNIKHITDLPNTWVNDIKKSYFSQLSLRPFLPDFGLGIDENYLANLKKQDCAYDKYEPCIEWEIGKVLVESNIKKVEQLSKKAADLILSTAYFQKSKKKLSDLNINDSLIDKHIIDNGNYILYILHKSNKKLSSKIIGAKASNMCFMQYTKGAEPEVVTVYGSSVRFESVIYSLCSMYQHTNKKFTDDELKVDNNPVNMDDFRVIVRNGSSNTILNAIEHFRVSIAVHKSTGVVYLLGGQISYTEVHNTYKIFRFKSLKDAVKATYWLYTGKFIYNRQSVKEISPFSSVLNTLLYIDSIRNNVPNDKLDKCKDANGLGYIRQLILDGYPNGYELPGFQGDIFNCCAKQPK